MTSPAAPRESEEDNVIRARRRVTDALHAMHADQRIAISSDLAFELDHAWNAYDAAIADSLRADLARVQGELDELTARYADCGPAQHQAIADEHIESLKQVAAQAAQIERLTQELEPLRIRQRRMDIQELRVLIDGYQGTCFPLNRTSLHGLFDEIERQAQEIAALREVVELGRRWITAAEESEEDGEDEATMDAGHAFSKALARLDAAPAETAKTPFQKATDELTGGCGCACHTGIGYRTSCDHCYRAPAEAQR